MGGGVAMGLPEKPMGSTFNGAATRGTMRKHQLVKGMMKA